MEKKITVNFNGSMVKTTKVLSFIFVVVALIGSILTFLITMNLVFTIIVFASSFLMFFVLLCLSTLLEQLYLIRKLIEIKVESEGFEITLD